jgi:hypothetical protein
MFYNKLTKLIQVKYEHKYHSNRSARHNISLVRNGVRHGIFGWQTGAIFGKMFYSGEIHCAA